MKRRRMQIDLRPEDELHLERARVALGTEADSDTGRALLGFFAKISAAIEQGTVISFLPGDDPRAVDAVPELTRALRPETRYRHLVSVPHPWRRQLSLKGRRMTVGQLIDAMEADGWSAEETAVQFDLPREAVLEAIEYYAGNRSLVDSEAAEQRRRVDLAATHHAPTPR